ncbi:hypothetical protein KSI01_12180 [Kurthia sibirica]|nr:hypothetical protein KSI01_12180 [Kurthia sibirica]
MVASTSKRAFTALTLGILILQTLLITAPVQAKKSLPSIKITKQTTAYKGIGKGKLTTKIPPSIYKQYGKKGQWFKVKTQYKQYVWIKGAKKITATRSAEYRKMETDIIRLVNKERGKYNLKKLKNSASLKVMTTVRAQDMISQNYFGHYSPIYGRWSQFLYTNEYKFSLAGENVASGFVTAQGFVNAWMKSETHRENILNRRFNKMAITVLPGKSKNRYQTYAVQWFAQQ